MSRSYKHTPCVQDQTTKCLKKYANRVIRHTKDVPQYKGYRKCFETWDIRDYVFFATFDEYKLSQSRMDNFERLVLGRDVEIRSEKQLYNEWFKMYKRK